MPKRNQGEAQEQMKVFAWSNLMLGKYPQLRYMYHIPNGGTRNTIEAKNLKRQGVKPGVPDIFLPCPKGGYHGLYIEMKYGNNKPSAYQKEFLKFLNNQNYYATVCYSSEEAIKTITLYLSLAKEHKNKEE